MTTRAPFEQEGYHFMAAAFEVYNELGPGFTEDVYQQALEAELQARKIEFLRGACLPLMHKGQRLLRTFKPDLIVSGGMIIELKALSALTRDHESQLFNYLKVTHKPVGNLVNLGPMEKLEWKRYVRTKFRPLETISEN